MCFQSSLCSSLYSVYMLFLLHENNSPVILLKTWASKRDFWNKLDAYKNFLQIQQARTWAYRERVASAYSRNNDKSTVCNMLAVAQLW